MAERKEQGGRFGWAGKSSSVLVKSVKLSSAPAASLPSGISSSGAENPARKERFHAQTTSAAQPGRVRKDEPGVAVRTSQGQGKLNTQRQTPARVTGTPFKKHVARSRGQGGVRGKKAVSTAGSKGREIKKQLTSFDAGLSKREAVEDVLNGNDEESGSEGREREEGEVGTDRASGSTATTLLEDTRSGYRSQDTPSNRPTAAGLDLSTGTAQEISRTRLAEDTRVNNNRTTLRRVDVSGFQDKRTSRERMEMNSNRTTGGRKANKIKEAHVVPVLNKAAGDRREESRTDGSRQGMEADTDSTLCTDAKDENQNPTELIPEEEGDKNAHLQIHCAPDRQHVQSLDNENSTSQPIPAISDGLGYTVLRGDSKASDINDERDSIKGGQSPSAVAARKGRPLEPPSYGKTRQTTTHKRKEIDSGRGLVTASAGSKRIASHAPTTQRQTTGQSKKADDTKPPPPLAQSTKSAREPHTRGSRHVRRDSQTIASGIPTAAHVKRADTAGVAGGKASSGGKSYTYKSRTRKSEKVRGVSARKSSKDASGAESRSDTSANSSLDSNGNLGPEAGAPARSNLNLSAGESQRKKPQQPGSGSNRKGGSKYSVTQKPDPVEPLPPKNISRLSKAGKREAIKVNAKEILQNAGQSSRIPCSGGSGKPVNKPIAASGGTVGSTAKKAGPCMQQSITEAPAPSYSSKPGNTYSLHQQLAEERNTAEVLATGGATRGGGAHKEKELRAEEYKQPPKTTHNSGYVKEVRRGAEKTPGPPLASHLHACVHKDVVETDLGKQDVPADSVKERNSHCFHQLSVKGRIKSAASESSTADINNTSTRTDCGAEPRGSTAASATLPERGIHSAKSRRNSQQPNVNTRRSSTNSQFKSQLAEANPRKSRDSFDELTPDKSAAGASRKNKASPTTAAVTNRSSGELPSELPTYKSESGDRKPRLATGLYQEIRPRDGSKAGGHESCTGEEIVAHNTDSPAEAARATLIKESACLETDAVAPSDKTLTSKLPISTSSSGRYSGSHGNSISGESRNRAGEVLESGSSSSNSVKARDGKPDKDASGTQAPAKADAIGETKARNLDKPSEGITDSPQSGVKVNNNNHNTQQKVVRHESGFKKLANLAKHLSQQWSRPRTYIQTRQEPRQTKSDTTLLQERKYAQRERDGNLYGYQTSESNKSRSLFRRAKYSSKQPRTDVNSKPLVRGQSEKTLLDGVDLQTSDAGGERSNIVIQSDKTARGQRSSPSKHKDVRLDRADKRKDKKSGDKNRALKGHAVQGHAEELSFTPTRWTSDQNLRKELTLEFIDAESVGGEDVKLFTNKNNPGLTKETRGDGLLTYENIYGIESLVSEIDKLSSVIYSSEGSAHQMPNPASLSACVLDGYSSHEALHTEDIGNSTGDNVAAYDSLSLRSSDYGNAQQIAMPFGCGNKVAMVDVDDVRRKQATVKRGASCPSTTSGRVKARETLKSRPRSADFDAKSHKSCDIPCFRKTHARSPSDGTIDILDFINSQTDIRRDQTEPDTVQSDSKKQQSMVQTAATQTTTTTSVTFQKPSRKDVRVTLTPSSPKSPSLLNKMFSFKRSPMLRSSVERERGCSGSVTTVTPGQNDAGEAPCSVPEVEEKRGNRDMCIKLKRYHSLSRKEGCPTPPLAVFSSSEDIASLPQTPRQESSPLPGASHVTSLPGNTEPSSTPPPPFPSTATSQTSISPAHTRTISPELEDEIGKLLLEPPKYKTYHQQFSEPEPGKTSSQAPGEGDTPANIPAQTPRPASHPPSLTTCQSVDSAGSERISSPTSYHHFQRQTPMIAGIPVTKTYAGYLQKKYASLRHHSTDLSVPITAMYSTRTINTPGVAVATSKSGGTTVTYSSQRRNQEYVRRRHHTVDIVYQGPSTLTKTSKDVSSTCVAVTCDAADVLGTVVTAVVTSLNQTFTSPASPSRAHPTSSPDRSSVSRPPPWRQSSREDSPHWSPLCEDLSPWRQPPRDVPEQLLLSDVASNDSGIQDETPSSTESFRLQHQLDGIMARHMVCRASPGVSPGTSPERHGRERPKSDCLTVRWADTISEELFPVDRRRRRVPTKERPKSDLGGRRAISEALRSLGVAEKPIDSLSALPHIPGASPNLPLPDRARIKNRRMSTPSPIKSRSVRNPIKLRSPKRKVRKAKSAPDLLETCSSYTRSRRKIMFHASSMEAGDLAIQPHVVYTSDEDETSEDGVSIAASETSSASSTGKQNLLDEIFDEKAPTFAEALWDHVTMDPDELGFRAGDVIEVTDQTDKDWWWGRINRYEGWFPAAFVRLRANQTETADDLAQKVKDGAIDSHTALRRYSNALLSKEQARTNVVQEIIFAEREYVKHLRDVVEGYVEKARKRPEMFPDDRLKTIFGNIEDIYMFSATFLSDLEKNVKDHAPHMSELGQVFIRYKRGFEIYSEYCNNHPHACEELQTFQKNRRYQHFFEACRLLQEMIEIPLEGFLLTPVQKICKYPLQLKELLKYTRPEHPDYTALQKALDSMKQIAVLINERKRKMESIEKLAEWQESVEDWQGPDLLESSSELIYSGELTKVNSGGWHQERVFFLFDHQLIYCKKDLLWRDMMVYKGRINTDNCIIHPVQDGKDITFNVNVKHAFKIYDHVREKWYLLYCRNSAERDRWLKAFQEERGCCKKDRENGFSVKDFKRHVILPGNQRSHPPKHKGKHQKSKDNTTADYNETSYTIPSHVTLPRSHGQGGKRSWFPFRKVKR